MSSARRETMGRLKAVLDKSHNPTVRLSTADQRIKDLPPALIPKRGQSDVAARTEVFVAEAKFAVAEVVELSALSQVPGAMKKILADAGATQLKATPHKDVQGLDWAGVEISYGRGEGTDLVGLSVAYAGVAETGTLVLRSAPNSPTTLNFLPDVHVVILHSSEIEANYEAVWTRLRSGEGGLPRTVNWITGPSRTADIEQTILLGAHGPRKLVILLVDENA